MDRQAISVILKNLFPLYPPVFVWVLLDLLKRKTRQYPHTIQPTRWSPIMSNHDPIYAQCVDQFKNACTTSFLQTPYEWQTAVGSTILAAHTTKNSIYQLLVRPTGGGNTLVYTATASCIKVITLCICPLIILGLDQYQSLIAKTSSYCSIAVFHLDELSPHEVDNVLLPKLTALSPYQTVIIFTSPQCLLSHCYNVLETLIVMKLIRFVVVDEVHIFNRFGLSFRKEFPALREPLFGKLTTTPILMMTDKCTHCICDSIQTMPGLKLQAHIDHVIRRWIITASILMPITQTIQWVM